MIVPFNEAFILYFFWVGDWSLGSQQGRGRQTDKDYASIKNYFSIFLIYCTFSSFMLSCAIVVLLLCLFFREKMFLMNDKDFSALLCL